MSDEGINTIEFIKARSMEIESIEKSLSVSHKKSLPWQRMPYYRRRRNRNYDKRKFAKIKHRLKDRHFLRTHTFYAKRYEMLKTNEYSVPYVSRLKNAKYIYKSESRGYIFDESFRKVEVSLIGENKNLENLENRKLMNNMSLEIKNKIQYFGNVYERILDNDKLISIGDCEEKDSDKEYECVISVLKKFDHKFKELNDVECKIFKNCYSESKELQKIDLTGGKCDLVNLSDLPKLESHKIFCRRTNIMLIFQRLINSGFIPCGLKDIERLALENDTMTIYDNVNSKLYKTIDEAINEKIIDKIKRTPRGKKQEYDTNKLYIYEDAKILIYFTFVCLKGSCKSKGEIFVNGNCIGKVVRADYKFSCGKICGLGFLKRDVAIDEIKNEKILCKSLGDRNFYEIKIIKFIKE